MGNIEWRIRSIIRVRCYGGMAISKGLVVDNLKTKKVYFLDESNSRELLLSIYKITNPESKDLDTLLGCCSLILTLSGVNFIVVDSLPDFIKANNIIKKRRSVEDMHKISKSIKEAIVSVASVNCL